MKPELGDPHSIVMPNHHPRLISSLVSTLGVSRGRALLLFAAATLSASAFAQERDPFSTRALLPDSPAGASVVCRSVEGERLALIGVIERALCANPQTRDAFAQARIQAASLGVARGAYLPSLTATAGNRRNVAAGQSEIDNSLSASLSYTLFDSGLRGAQLESARQSLAGALASQEAAVQSVFYSAAEAYFQWFAKQAALEAAREAERAFGVSLEAAKVRRKAGSATLSDELQAQTAYSQSVLARIRAEGDAQSASGALASVMGLAANRLPAVSAPEMTPSFTVLREVDELIEKARKLRPDFAAAQARVSAAQSNVDAERAAGRPSVALSASRNVLDPAGGGANYSSQIGVNLTIPIFSGFTRSYRVAAAQADLESKNVARDALDQRLSLEVWRAYYAFKSDTQALAASDDLERAATQSASVALARYQAGLGSILDVLNAQSAAANARSTAIGARYGWQISRLALLQAVGQLDFGTLAGGQEK